MSLGIRLIIIIGVLVYGQSSCLWAEELTSETASPITIYTYEIPGLIQNQNEQPAGLGIETLTLLFDKAGYSVDFQLHPFARV